MIRFVSEGGNSAGTKILNAETGEDIGDVIPVDYGASITFAHDGIVRAYCSIIMTEVNVVAGHTEWHTKDPISGRWGPIRSIEFCDGARVDFAPDGTPTITEPKAAA